MITYVDASYNKLKDEFANVALNALKLNTSVLTINLIGNPIGFHKIQAINYALENNKNTVRRNKIPSYKDKILNMESNMIDIDIVYKSIARAEKEYLEEEKAIGIMKNKLTNTAKIESKNSLVLQIKLDKITDNFKDITKNLYAFDKKYDNDETTIKEKIDQLERKIRIAENGIDIINNESKY